MDWTYNQSLKRFSNELRPYLHKSRHGLEREGLRVDPQGKIAQTNHPSAFGSKLTHPHITTDYGEAQLELVTGVCSDERHLLASLHRLQRYVLGHLDDEFLWPASTPCRFTDVSEIQLARFGTSEKGRLKEVYRKGLAHRYGSKMETLSGIHYNFSLDRTLWKALGIDSSTGYLHIIRNYFRWSWLNSYLFGATPAVDKSYIDRPHPALQELSADTLWAPHATSIRMSELGYYSKVQTQLAISVNDIDTYLADLHNALSTPYAAWSRIPKDEQISDHLLQIEAEHYQRMRPKPKPGTGRRALDELRISGIHYVEARGVDINPLSPDGIELDQLLFLHTLCLFCLLQPSPMLSQNESTIVMRNQNCAALHGRDPAFRLVSEAGPRTIPEWAGELLSSMHGVAELLGEVHVASLKRQQAKLADPSLLPANQLLAAMKEHGNSHQALCLHLAKHNKAAILKRRPATTFGQRMDAIAIQSNADRERLELHDEFVLAGHEDLELSTQIIIREARRRGVDVTILDRADNFLRLTKGAHVEYVKQATMTNRDSIVTYCIMENKEVSKVVLRDAGIRVPAGFRATTLEEALESYPLWSAKKMVVKPTFTNYGLGITMVEPGDHLAFVAGVKLALTFGNDFLVEEFIPGDEFRILVIDSKVAAVCQRIPANVHGDGKHTIKQLVHMKNHDPLSYKLPKYYIRTGKIERSILAEQGYNFDTVLAVGTVAYLRKVSNVSTGGDPVDLTDELHPGWGEIAIKATEAVGATFCGLDLLTPNCRLAPTVDNHAFIEVNFNPALWMHRYPARGKPRFVERATMDALGF